MSRELLSSSGLGSQSSLTPVLEHKPDLSSHVPPAFSLGIIAGGEPGPPAPMYTAAPGMPGGKPMGWAHSPARGAREGDSCAKVCSGAAARSFGRLAQALAFAALLLLAMVAGLAAWPHHGRSGRDPKQGSQYAAGGLATDVDPIPELPRRFLERITGGGQAGSARDRRSVYDMRLEALTAGQAGARGAGLGLALAEAGAEGGEAEKAEVLTRDAVAAERLHLAMKAAAADASSAGARARAKLTSVRSPHSGTACIPFSDIKHEMEASVGCIPKRICGFYKSELVWTYICAFRVTMLLDPAWGELSCYCYVTTSLPLLLLQAQPPQQVRDVATCACSGCGAHADHGDEQHGQLAFCQPGRRRREHPGRPGEAEEGAEGCRPCSRPQPWP